MDGLVADLDAPIGQDVFDVAKAHAETIVGLNRVADKLARKTVAFEGVNS